MKRTTRRLVFGAIGVVAAVTIFGAGGLLYYAFATLPAVSGPIAFSVKAGSSLRSAAEQMAQAGALRHPELFVAMARLLGEAGNVKAGSFELEAPLSPYRLLRRVTRGDYTLAAITLVEGWTFKQVRAALDAHPQVRHDTAGWSEAEILQRLGLEAPSAEGLFFPETYHFSEGTSDLAILRRAARLMDSHLAALWAERAPDLPLATPYEALILASIVEKETARPEERPLVAAVLANRLRRGMKLQADPTVIYGLGEEFDGNLRKRDLQRDTPYNTYTRPGLPPTPIAIPGLASLSAAVNPARSDVLYFVSKGDGTSHFSRTLPEHDRAVSRYQKAGRR
jgi:UPF0755 protein